MGINKYIDSVCRNIENKKIHDSVTRELYSHLIEQKEIFIDQGLDPSEAEHKSVKEMGNPYIVGERLNKIHRRKPEWSLLIIILLIIILGAIFQIVVFKGMINYKIITNSLTSVFIFLLFYFIDYTFLIKYKFEIFVGIILLVLMPFIVTPFQQYFWYFILIVPPIIAMFKSQKRNKYNYKDEINKKDNIWLNQFFLLSGYPSNQRWRGIFTIAFVLYILNSSASLSNIQGIYLYILIFLIMFITLQFKTKMKIIPFILYYGFILSYGLYFKDFSKLMHIFIIIAATLTYMLNRNWFHIKKSIGISLIWAPLLLNIFSEIIDYSINGIKLDNWIENLNTVFINNDELNMILQGANYIGKGSYKFEFNFDEMQYFILTYIIGNFGWIAGVALIGLLFLLVIYLIKNTFKSKQEFGRVISFACSATICVEVITYIISNLGALSFPPGFLPFFAGSYLGTMLNAACLGLILSIRSNRNIVDEIGIILKGVV